MKNQQLIAMLQQYPADAEVRIVAADFASAGNESKPLDYIQASGTLGRFLANPKPEQVDLIELGSTDLMC